MFDELLGLACWFNPALAKFGKGKNGQAHPSCGRENVRLES